MLFSVRTPSLSTNTWPPSLCSPDCSDLTCSTDDLPSSGGAGVLCFEGTRVEISWGPSPYGPVPESPILLTRTSVGALALPSASTQLPPVTACRFDFYLGLGTPGPFPSSRMLIISGSIDLPFIMLGLVGIAVSKFLCMESDFLVFAITVFARALGLFYRTNTALEDALLQLVWLLSGVRSTRWNMRTAGSLV